jgi:predicted acyl esterase
MKSSYRGIFAALVVVVALVVAPAANAEVSSVFGGSVPCAPQSSYGEVRLCSYPTLSFDGTKVDVNVILPPASQGDGPFPLIGDFHGWGGAKQGLFKTEPASGLVTQQEDPRIKGWAEHGYAVFSMTDRGWGFSCGKYDPQVSTAICEHGYNHLMDDRYEVRDAQYFMGILAAEGRIIPNKIGATGGSFGGGISMALGALRNRVMKEHGELVSWESPTHQQMEIAAAVPQYSWSDLAYALLPNGRTLDYLAENNYSGPEGSYPIGVEKASFVGGLYLTGAALSNYSTSDPEADIPGWYARMVAGEPYNGDPSAEEIIKQVTTYHSSYYIDHAEEPAPMLIQNGWNDDLFPADEALRFYERTRSQYPGNPISLYFTDIGHQRSQDKEADSIAFNAKLEAWFAHYLKGENAAPTSTVEAKTTTCPSSVPSGGPYSADDWNDLSPGEIRLESMPAQTIVPGAGNSTAGIAFDPIAGLGACASVEDGNTVGVANYKLPAAPEGGYTLMGSPTIIADVEAAGPNSEIAARLIDVSPGGSESLIARGLYRPDAGRVQAVFQLHPNGYHFEAGHVAKLELLPSDAPYARASNLQDPITISHLELRLPVLQEPGALGGLVKSPAPYVVPTGAQLSPENKPNTGGSTGGTETKPAPVIKIGVGGLSGKLSANRKTLTVPMSCSAAGACSGRLLVRTKRGKGTATLGKGSYSIAAGSGKKVKLKLTKNGRKLVKEAKSKKLGSMVQLDDSGRPLSLTLKRPVHLQGGR